MPLLLTKTTIIMIAATTTTKKVSNKSKTQTTLASIPRIINVHYDDGHEFNQLNTSIVARSIIHSLIEASIIIRRYCQENRAN